MIDLKVFKNRRPQKEETQKEVEEPVKIWSKNILDLNDLLRWIVKVKKDGFVYSFYEINVVHEGTCGDYAVEVNEWKNGINRGVEVSKKPEFDIQIDRFDNILYLIAYSSECTYEIVDFQGIIEEETKVKKHSSHITIASLNNEYNKGIVTVDSTQHGRLYFEITTMINSQLSATDINGNYTTGVHFKTVLIHEYLTKEDIGIDVVAFTDPSFSTIEIRLLYTYDNSINYYDYTVLETKEIL